MSASLEAHAPVSPARPWLTSGQFTWVMAQVAVVALALLAMATVRPDTTALLWTTSTGLRMLLAALGCLAISAGGFAGACWLVNRRLPGEAHGTQRTILSVVAGVLLGILFLAPAVFVVTIGPSALQIQQTLLTDAR